LELTLIGGEEILAVCHCVSLGVGCAVYVDEDGGEETAEETLYAI